MAKDRGARSSTSSFSVVGWSGNSCWVNSVIFLCFFMYERDPTSFPINDEDFDPIISICKEIESGIQNRTPNKPKIMSLREEIRCKLHQVGEMGSASNMVMYIFEKKLPLPKAQKSAEAFMPLDPNSDRRFDTDCITRRYRTTGPCMSILDYRTSDLITIQQHDNLRLYKLNLSHHLAACEKHNKKSFIVS